MEELQAFMSLPTCSARKSLQIWWTKAIYFPIWAPTICRLFLYLSGGTSDFIITKKTNMSTWLISGSSRCKDCRRYSKTYLYADLKSVQIRSADEKRNLYVDILLKKKTLMKLEWIIKLIIALYNIDNYCFYN